MSKIKKIFTLARIYSMQDGWRSYTRFDDGELQLAGFSMKESWHDRFCADPFLFRYDGFNWLFYETVTKGARKGVIGCFKEVEGQWIQQGKIFEQPWHLSYPQVFEKDGHIYMIPEESNLGQGSVNIYEATDFPKGWEKRKTLIDRPFCDATILEYDAHWYMACCPISESEKAELWHSESLFGPWERHPMWDEISQSNQLRRCGGKFIEREGQLFRVAQDCDGFYGKRLFMVPVLEISSTFYREGEAKLLYDNTMPPYRFAHTYNEIMVDSKRLSVVDVHWDELKNPIKILRDIWHSIQTCRKHQ